MGLAFAGLVQAGDTTTPPDWSIRRPVTFEALRAGFQEPEMIYAPFAFWFWDEPLNAEKLAEMAQTMAGQRLNPGYVHPRTNAPGVARRNPLPPDQWLSPLWFDAFKSALGKAEAVNGYLGFCDEYMWPSFQAAGRVLKRDPGLKSSSLEFATFEVSGGASCQVPASFFAVAAQLAEPGPIVRPLPYPPLGAWIWMPGAQAGVNQCFFRKPFDLPSGAQVKRGLIRITADNGYVLYVNGKKAGQGDDWSKVGLWNVTALLRPGKNILAVEGEGQGGLDAMTLGLRVDLEGGTTKVIRSEGDWKVASTPTPGWQEASLDDSAWQKVRVVSADPGAQPWKLSGGEEGPHVPATIRSSTLAVIGAGASFPWSAPAGGNWRVYVFNKRMIDEVNYLNERLPEAFRRIALDPWETHLGDQLGKSIPGVFVDNEGAYGSRLAWSEDLDRRYREKWGTDIRLGMPLMLDDDAEGAFARARWQWFDTVSDIYANVMGSTSRWSEERGMYCIENLWEESLELQARTTGDFFKLSRAYSMPGNDCLQSKALEVHDFKEVQSVSEFEGRRLMSEIMGAGGWKNFTPAFLKQAANSVTAWGVGHVVPHGIFTYRKLDNNEWTPDWYTENPWFPSLHLWSDFVRRASYINSHGRLVPDVLLVNPMDTIWARTSWEAFDSNTHGAPSNARNSWGARARSINDIYANAIGDLTASRVEFLIADRHYLGQMEAGKSGLARGDFHFKTVVLPPMDVLPLAAAQKITDFAKAGGIVYALGTLPTGSTELGMTDPAMTRLMEELQAQPGFRRCEDLKAALAKDEPGLESQIRFQSGEFAMLQHHLRIDGRDFYWLGNNTEQWQEPTLDVRGAAGAAALWDCETGEIRPVASEPSPTGSSVRLAFKPLEAYWLVFDPSAQPSPDAEPVRVPSRALAEITGPWRVRIVPEGQPVLEHPVKWPAEFEGEGTDRSLEPWSAWGLGHFSGVVDYLATFTVDKSASTAVQLDLGRLLYAAEVWVNGRAMGSRLWAPHVFNVTEALKPGKNEVRIRVANLVNNNYGDLRESGLFGPVTLQAVNKP
jgi:hypothetical protein